MIYVVYREYIMIGVVNMSEQDYFKEYMNVVEGTAEPVVKGVLLFFLTKFGEEQVEEMTSVIAQQNDCTLPNTEKLLKSKYNVDDETIRQILQLMQRKFKEAISAKEATSEKLAFIRSIKKKH